jgi:hypothetical protein
MNSNHVAMLTLSAALLAPAGCADPHSNDPVGTASEDGGDPVQRGDEPRDARARDTKPLDAGAKAPPRTAQPDCTPGSYTGEFTCLISGLVPWGGTMAFSLVEEASGAGEFQTLQIVPGTRLSGTDETFSGTFSADLQGTFDCRTGKLVGSLENGVYRIQGETPLSMRGGLEGTYLTDAGTPGFSGTMGPLGTPDFDLLGALAPTASCTWSTVRTGAAADGGLRRAAR